jgi:superfamily II DNA/RNA helicase
MFRFRTDCLCYCGVWEREQLPLLWFPNRFVTQHMVHSSEALTRTLLGTALMQELVRQVVPCLEQRPTLVFAASVEHAQQLASLFCQAGCSAVAVSGHLRPSPREGIYADWRAGHIQIVCNCRLLTEGFDFPAIAALAIARPTRSPGLYVQMLGRGTRTAPGKRDCLVIDTRLRMKVSPSSETPLVPCRKAAQRVSWQRTLLR